MKILVTGGAGFIGSSLVDVLIEQDHQVVIYDNFDPFYARETKLNNLRNAIGSSGAILVEGDIRDKKLLTATLEDNNIELVIHLAAKAGVRPSIKHPVEYFDVNVNGTVSVLESMRNAGVTRLVNASSSSVYGNNRKVPFAETDPVDNPISPYAASKRAAELSCSVYSHLYGFDITSLRFFTVYGPRQRPDLAISKFTSLIQQEDPIPFYGDGTTARDYTYITDIVNGIIAAVHHLNGYQLYNLGGRHTTTLKELVDHLAALLDKQAVLNPLPPQQGDVEKTWADTSKALVKIGYRPQVGIVDGLKRFIEWYKMDSKLKKRPSL
ncbi:GDP-mannose 4,6-dehydratase [Hufsiella ginkgonis]|uniref:SDR family NAD(P)-dependent oxidoreductase n=1 Tax=Hufsiella ginkgonis TaxID=2695274 RepID=A0A7K1Y374_9SPHI|nr:GDP-mannose 4,6-dehydratase [Hufsiella ginkgonis]MXV17479.1 SDR family NAD(P)-dependent oxidoreductase [Hufsiella ginkgonis]